MSLRKEDETDVGMYVCMYPIPNVSQCHAMPYTYRIVLGK
jgi:hypothetical protein